MPQTAQRHPAGMPDPGAPASIVPAAPALPPAITIIEAKLAPPQLRRGILPRTALLHRLLAANDGRVAVLLAPPGYGKSTTLALWRSRDPRPVAWLTVDGADADPIRLLLYLSVAIDRAGGLDAAVFDALTAQGVSALSTVVPRLATALHRRRDPLLVMLDDVHLLEGTPSTDALAMLIDYLPPTVTLALSGRGDAGLPLARYRASGRLLELSVADLALDETESGHVVRLAGHSPRPDEVRDLYVKTEGWPAAVYLAALGMRERRIPAEASTLDVSGRDRDIADYLDAEILTRATPRIREFLVRTSVLDRLTPQLCDAVVGRGGSEGVLRRLAATNQLVVPLDSRGDWYRYHPLLREHLRGLIERQPGEAGVLHQRAAAWLAMHDMTEDAVDHLLAAGDVDAAAGLVSTIGLRTYRIGRAATLERWIGRLDEPTLRRHPYLAALAAFIALLQGRATDADRMADLAAASEYVGARPTGAGSFEAVRAIVAAIMARQGMTAALADAELAASLEPASGPLRPVCLVVLGGLLAATGDLARADSVLRDAAATAEPLLAGRAHVTSIAWRALLAAERDDWAAADALIADSLGTLARYGYGADLTVTTATAVAARVALNRGDIAEARHQLAGFHVARPALSAAAPWLSVRSLLEASRAHLGLADPAGARALLQQAEDILARRPDLGGLADEVAAMRARIRALPPGPGGASTLTPSEIRVLRLLPTYLSAPQMAERLYVSQNTIRTQMQAIYGKLGASSRAEAVEVAIEVGLLEPLPVLAKGRIIST